MACRIRIGRIDIGIADIIALDEINTPGSIKFHQGIIVSLSCLRIADTVHIWVPSTDGGRICDHIGSHVAALDLTMVMRSSSWDSAHDMDTEF